MIDLILRLWFGWRMNTLPNKTSFKKGHGLKNLLAKKFGRLSVLEEAGRNKHNSAMWRCVCECGHEGVYKGTNLLSGHTKSCGCWSRETKELGAGRIHGHTSRYNGVTVEYTAWKNMISRCHHAKNAAYQSYGAKGINVCEKWKNSFPAFIADVGKRPSVDHSLHRKNSGLGYNPSNVVWATSEEQNNNKGNTVLIEHDGKKQSLALWAKETGLNRQAIINRIARGWSIARALTTPTQIKCRNHKAWHYTEPQGAT